MAAMTLRATFGTALALALTFASCESGSGSGSAKLAIVACSLGCASSTPGGQFSCDTTNIAVNEEIRITFNLPLDLDSVSNETFLVQAPDGTTPPQSFSLDPNDARVLIYRPLLSFNSSGEPNFGLQEDQTYFVKLPGTNLDLGATYIRSRSGQPLSTRLLCTLEASGGVFDAKPGPPRVDVRVDVIDPATSVRQPNQPAQGAFNVAKDTSIRMVFDDLMNPSTVADPVSGTSQFIQVLIDPDGDTDDPSDQVLQDGRFTLTLDQNALTTTLVFLPNGLFPSRGDSVVSPRKVVVRLPQTVSDLGGNPLANGGEYIFVSEQILFPVQGITEGFSGFLNEDAVRTGNAWGGGSLVKGPGGGSGRLGDLNLGIGQTVTLTTHDEDFSAITDPAIFDPTGVIGPVQVTDGVFEFAQLRVAPGAVLRLVGDVPAQVFVRGECQIQGTIDISGADATIHDSEDFAGGLGGQAGAGGGNGGDGGELPDGSDWLGVGGQVVNPAQVLYDDVDGKPGGGIAFPSLLAPTSFVANGEGGIFWPQPIPDDPLTPFDESTLAFPLPDDVGGMPMDPFIPSLECPPTPPPTGCSCSNIGCGGAGSGGGYATSGGAGDSRNFETSDLNAVPIPPTPGGDSRQLSIDDLVKTLDPELGYLRGGAGGGGGGSHLLGSFSNGSFSFGCDIFFNTSTFETEPANLELFAPASGGGGGGAGGGMRLQAGRRLVLDGVVDASGGDGSSCSASATVECRATPGGGGSGGAVLLQAPSITVSPTVRRLRIRGGRGGAGVRQNPSLAQVTPYSLGGNGGVGLLRLESFPPLPSFSAIAPSVDPNETTVVDDYGVTLDEVFTVDPWTPAPTGTTVFSGAQSCWFQPSGNFFLLDFQPDGAELGWDMTLDIPPFGLQSYRGPNDIFGPVDDLETVLGNELGSAAVVVRFQGARSKGPIPNGCGVDLYGPDADIVGGTLTPWVAHPEELNSVFPEDGQRPNMFRFTIIWDSRQPLFDSIESIDEITVRVKPN